MPIRTILASIVVVLILSSTMRGQQTPSCPNPQPSLPLKKQKSKPESQAPKDPTPVPSCCCQFPGQIAASAQLQIPSKEKAPDNKFHGEYQFNRGWISWFWPPIWSNWALVAAAIWAGIVALRTLVILRQTHVTQFRPRVIIRTMKLNPESFVQREAETSAEWVIELLVTNIGGTKAQIREGKVNIEWYGEHPPLLHTIGDEPYEGFSLLPGEYHMIKAVISNDASFTIQMHSAEVSFGSNNIQMRWIRCTGVILYADENGFERRTGFQRIYEIKTRSFVSIISEEYEYSD